MKSTSVDPRIVDAFLAENGFPLEPHLLVLAMVGSHSHGTYVPSEEPNAVNDVDLMGFVVPPVEYHLGLPRWQHWTMQREELDVVLYSLEKAIRLLLNSNPNIVGLLWLREAEYVYRNPAFDRLYEQRDIFSSQAVGETYSGYAYDQLKRMEAFDLGRMEEYEELTSAIRGKGPLMEVLEADAGKLKHIAAHWNLPLELLVRFRKLHKSHFSGYMGEKRKAVVRRYQYDVKNASHLIRLLRMGTEFLETGQLRVYRFADAEELIAIKRGEWTLDQVKVEADRLFQRIEEARAISPLPARPDAEAANDLLLSIHSQMLALDLQEE